MARGMKIAKRTPGLLAAFIVAACGAERGAVRGDGGTEEGGGEPYRLAKVPIPPCMKEGSPWTQRPVTEFFADGGYLYGTTSRNCPPSVTLFFRLSIVDGRIDILHSQFGQLVAFLKAGDSLYWSDGISSIWRMYSMASASS